MNNVFLSIMSFWPFQSITKPSEVQSYWTKSTTAALCVKVCFFFFDQWEEGQLISNKKED